MLILTIRMLPSGSTTLYDMPKPEVSPLLLHIYHREHSQSEPWNAGCQMQMMLSCFSWNLVCMVHKALQIQGHMP